MDIRYSSKIRPQIKPELTNIREYSSNMHKSVLLSARDNTKTPRENYSVDYS